jgi:hypothetical protein
MLDRQQLQMDLIVSVKSKAIIPDLIKNIKKTYLSYILRYVDKYSRNADCRFLRDKKTSSYAVALKEILDDM